MFASEFPACSISPDIVPPVALNIANPTTSAKTNIEIPISILLIAFLLNFNLLVYILPPYHLLPQQQLRHQLVGFLKK